MFTLSIDTDHLASRDHEAIIREITRLLRQAARRLIAGEDGGPLLSLDEQPVGTFKLRRD